jgi:tetratricopeptide (TPR) repeat protein
MGSAVSGGALSTLRAPRYRVFAAAALVAVFVLVVIAFVWGPFSSNSAKQSASSLLSAGLVAQNAGRTSEASDDYHKVLQLDPSNYWAYYNLGVIDQQAGGASSAERNYRSALALNPDLVPALYNLAILQSGPSPKEAEALYRHAIALDPKNASAHLNLGFLLLQEGSKAEGRAELDIAVKLDPHLASRLPLASPTASAAPSRKP